MLQAAAAVLGDAALSKTQKLNISAGPWQVEGLISSPVAGRRSRDAQLFFVNGRPIDAPKRVAKLINEAQMILIRGSDSKNVSKNVFFRSRFSVFARWNVG
eukprot:g16713.t1